MTIPAALLIAIGVLFCAGHAAYAGDLLDFKSAAIAGVIGTLANLIFFYRRLYFQMKAKQHRSKQQKENLGGSKSV